MNNTFDLKDYPINNFQDYKKAVEELFTVYEKTLDKSSLNKKYILPVNINKADVLVMGMNPSEVKENSNKKEYGLFMDIINNTTGQYWIAIKRMVKNLDKSYTLEHIDLFSIRKTDQDALAKEGTQNLIIREFLSKQAALTQELIENVIKPKIIIVPNKSQWAYWGKEKLMWMGYDLEMISDNEKDDKVLMKIIGLKKEDAISGKCINPYMIDTTLKGTKILFGRFQSNGCPINKRITPEDIKEALSETV